MAVIDVLRNLYTLYGFEAAESDAVDSEATADRATNVDVLGAAPTASPTGAAKQAVIDHEEPGPDNTSKRGASLELREFDNLPLFSSGPDEDNPVQGFLNNCPLVAILIAMAHVTNHNGALTRGAVVRRLSLTYATFRQRQSYEYLVNELPAALPRLPDQSGFFEGDHVFSVTFFRNSTRVTRGKRGEIHVHWGSAKSSKLVTPVFYFDTEPPAGLFYGHSGVDEVWVNAIEKGYVFLYTPSNPNYQEINFGIEPDVAMFELTAYSRMGLISDDNNPGAELLTAGQLKNWVGRHASRPTIVGSRDVLPVDPGTGDTHPILIDNHTYAVVGFNSSASTVTLIDALKEPGELDRRFTVSLAELRANMEAIVQGPTQFGQSSLTETKT